MKNARYYGPDVPCEYTVLAKGFRPFETDNLEEALHDASIKADVSAHVSVLNINDHTLAEWRYGKRIYR